MDIISENIANAETTRTEDGGQYSRKMVVYSADGGDSSFDRILNDKMQPNSYGVVVSDIVEDDTEFTSVYDPTHVDADENGYVLMPNVDVTTETLDMMAASQAYQANITVFNAVKAMASKALEMGE
jgi:flagellar basal-body rod protein FlgC